jgi:hypothetical protein
MLDGGIFTPISQAVLFSGVQAQLISITNDDSSNSLAVATNAAFFGGLMLSVFSAMLATCTSSLFRPSQSQSHICDSVRKVVFYS